MHLLPLSLGRLAEHASKHARHFATDNVLLRLNPDNTFDAVATDTKCLARVTGPCVAPPGDFPIFPELADAADGGTSALVPAEFWRRVFSWGRKLTRRDVTNPACRSVAVRIGARETTFGVTDERSPWADAAAHAAGRFPSHEELIASTAEQSVVDRFAVDPVLLADLLRTAAEFCAPGDPRVEIETRGPRQPLTIHAGRPGGLEFFGILLPLWSDVRPAPPAHAPAQTPVPPPAPPAPPAEAERVAALQAERAAAVARITALEGTGAQLRVERDALAAEVAQLKAALNAARTRTIPGIEE